MNALLYQLKKPYNNMGLPNFREEMLDLFELDTSDDFKDLEFQVEFRNLDILVAYYDRQSPKKRQADDDSFEDYQSMME